MKKVLRICNRLLTILLVLVILFTGYAFLSVLRAGKDHVPSVFGFSFLRVVTGSMEPTIPVGVMIIVRNTDADKVKTGDIICFYSSDPSIEDLPNTHRVVEIRNENGDISFVTKGDATDKIDPYPVTADRLVGVYLRSFSVGKIYDIIHNPAFFFFGLLLPMIGVIFFEFLKAKNSMFKKEDTDAHDA